MHWKEAHAGHFKHGKLDFDEMNVNPQCPGCNTYRGGKLDIYALKLIELHGLEAVQELVIRASQQQPYAHQDLIEIIQDLKDKIKSL